jgi:hypothetical protein
LQRVVFNFSRSSGQAFYRNEKRVTPALISRIMNRASGLLRIDIDERMELENAATLTLAKKLGLVS